MLNITAIFCLIGEHIFESIRAMGHALTFPVAPKRQADGTAGRL